MVKPKRLRPETPMYQRQSRKIMLTSWLLSMLLNLLLLCLLLVLLPQQLRSPSETGLQVDLISVPNQPPPNPRVAARPRVTRSSQLITVFSPQAPSPPTVVPLTTHARHIVRSPNEPSLAPPDETVLVDDWQLPMDAAAHSNAPIQNTPLTHGVDASRSTRPSVDAPRRAGNWLKDLREEAGAVPQAQVSGSGQGITGYYNIATVQYEDTADAMRGQALSRLVGAMNRWTNVHTQLLPGSTPLANPAIQHIPLVYIAARSAFAFSEKERANLRAYLQNGGTLLFSDISPEWGIRGPVANSIRFELWKILDEGTDLRPIQREDAVCTSFFEFKKGAPLEDKERGQFYALWLDDRIAVFYDAAGVGLKWMEAG
ncbi:MAG: DUF4159 domain-containing protein, partial [Bacteroidota bacterium]